MKEIKFRIIYNNKILGYEKIVDGDWQWMCPELNPDGGERWTNGSFPSTSENHYKTSRDQFTGKTDKADKEIYEGDIFGNPNLRRVVEREENGAFVLRFLDKRIKTISILDHKVKSSRVIGNIHENPELLNQKTESICAS